MFVHDFKWDSKEVYLYDIIKNSSMKKTINIQIPAAGRTVAIS